MSKREKMLLQILICIGVVGVLTVYLLLPAFKKYKQLNSNLDMVNLQKDDMDIVLAADGINESYAEAVENAEKAHNFFDIKLNSFTADSMINEMLDNNKLVIRNLQIGKYQEIPDITLGIVPKSNEEDSDENSDDEDSDSEEDFLEDGDNEPTLEMLECMEISISLEGAYKDMCNFMDDFNETSNCVEIIEMSYSKDASYNPYDTVEEAMEHEGEETDRVIAQVKLRAYKVKSYDEAKESGIFDNLNSGDE